MHQCTDSSVVQTMACNWIVTKLLPKPMLTYCLYCLLISWKQAPLCFELKKKQFFFMNHNNMLHVLVGLSHTLTGPDSGPCLNKMTIFHRYGDSHIKDKTVMRLLYPYHGDPYNSKMTSLYWNDPQVSNGHVNSKCDMAFMYEVTVNTETTPTRDISIQRLYCQVYGSPL